MKSKNQDFGFDGPRLDGLSCKRLFLAVSDNSMKIKKKKKKKKKACSGNSEIKRAL